MDIYQHFRKEEHAFIDQVLSWKDDVNRSYRNKLTDFLDPRQQFIVDSLTGKNDDVKVWQFGGGRHSERQRALITPFYEQVQQEDFGLCLLQASYQEKFSTLTHRDVLGTFISLGLKRDKLGDIQVSNGLIQMIVADEIAKFVVLQMTTVKRMKISMEEKPLSAYREQPSVWNEMGRTVSSLRLDTVLKEIYHVSRKEASDYIKKQAVKVNFKLVEDVKFQVCEQDIISVRSKGRSKLVKIEGKTKKR
ncbi:YlmH/Sll1252 family protein [Virgibacillus halophilus]|uniref:YlmH/Sll1252 family protein n=1 Tax=Tigheibacillus halophilus TaxID=361280 RepID=A0ABU5CAF6_9BACI|nr:YlmH/Sll1252 family protein [Virgibacillus halophilus]